MIVLHAIWSIADGLRVWGENTGGSAAPVAAGHAAEQMRMHPFACEAGALEDALGGEVPEARLCGLLLPSSRSAPLSSPNGARRVIEGEDEASDPGEIVLAPWAAPACTLSPADALDLLLDLESARGAHVEIGASLEFLGTMARYAVELCARGRVLPRLIEEDGAFRSQWSPVLRGEEQRLSLLERAIPAACRCNLTVDSTTEPLNGYPTVGLEPASEVIEAALAALTDACSRRVLAASGPERVFWDRRLPRSTAAWLKSLADPDDPLIGPTRSLSLLESDLKTWLAAASPPTAAPFRLSFRLAAPNSHLGEADQDGEVGPWRLHFELQALDDPSLVVPAEHVWSTRGRTLNVLQTRLSDPQEWLLSELGRALPLLPELEGALRSPRPCSVELDVEGAHRFLVRSVESLQASGYGVIVPKWWNETNGRIGAQLVATPETVANGSGGFGLDALCEYEWRISLGGEVLSAEEFRELALLKQPLVRHRRQWVELRPHDVEAVARLLDQNGDGNGAVRAVDALRLAAGVQTVAGQIDVQSVIGHGWMAPLLEGEVHPEPLTTPPGLHGALRPYQERGLAWLAFLDAVGLGACLADDMGLGKTIQLLALLLHERSQRRGSEPGSTLLVCPMSVVGNWQHEAARFAPDLRVHVHHGGGRAGDAEQLAEAARESDLVITTYALTARDRDLLQAIEWHRVVLDEAQNIKNSTAAQSRAVRALRAPRRIALTGTPVENRLSELWSLMEFLNPGLLGSAREFRQNFILPIERHQDEESAERLRRLTGPFILRRLKTDRGIIRDLPDKMEMKVYCNLTREQAALYQAVVDDMLSAVKESQGIERKGIILAAMTKLKQVCNHPAHLLGDRSALAGRSGKLALLEEIVEEALAVGDRTLIFTQFAEMGRMLKEYLTRRTDREVLFLHGRTPRAARDQMVARFQQPEGPPLFVLSLKAGGTGLNLTAANQVVHFDRWWNPAVENQATDRAFRIGQRRNVQVRKLISTGTLEERIDEMIERKQALAERVVGTGEGWLTELSTAELREIVRLSADSVSEQEDR